MSQESKKERKERRQRNRARKAELLKPSDLPIDRDHSRARFTSGMRGRSATLTAVLAMTGLVAASPATLNAEVDREVADRLKDKPEN